ncbi:MAG TPA: hypothetical protein VLT45_31545 [Kofleriaceae bacterium]|nr:hypothetical protein [Kofleriaceae bacterium]
MVGFITERNFEQAELEFPGIVALYEALPIKPLTFLELLQQYLDVSTDSRPRRRGRAQ